MTAKRKVSNKDVAIAALTNDMVELRDNLLPHMVDAFGIISKARDSLLDMGQGDAADRLNVFMEENGITEEKGSGTRGRSAPSLGDTRNLKVQEVNGSRFVRLNVMALEVMKGESLTVEYRADGSILVTPSPVEVEATQEG